MPFVEVEGRADPFILSAIAAGKYNLPPLAPGEIRILPRNVTQGKYIRTLSSQSWCQLSPTQRLMLLDYAVWLGNDIYDWLDQQYGIRAAWNRCPPAGSY